MATNDRKPDTAAKDSQTADVAEMGDVSDMVERRRYEDILDVRDQARQMKIETARVANHTSRRELANLEFARAVEAYVEELEYQLTSTDVGTKYWERADLGTWHLEPPEPAQMAWDHKRKNDVNRNTLDRPKDELPPDYQIYDEKDFDVEKIHVQGLKTYLALPSRREVEHTAEFCIEFHGWKDITETYYSVIPWRISRNAYRACNLFLGELDLDISAEESEDPLEV